MAATQVCALSHTARMYYKLLLLLQSGAGSSKLSSLVTLHTSMGDMQIKLFPE